MKVLKSRLADWLITQLSSNALFGRNKWLFHSLLLPPAWWRNEKLSWITRLIPCFFFFFFSHALLQPQTVQTTYLSVNLPAQRYQPPLFRLFSRRALPFQHLLPSLLITWVQCSNLGCCNAGSALTGSPVPKSHSWLQSQRGWSGGGDLKITLAFV